MAHRWVRHEICEGMRLLEYHEDDQPMRLYLEVAGDSGNGIETILFSIETLKVLGAAMEKTQCR